MRTAKRSTKQLVTTSKSRENVFKFMERFHGRHYWTINGPMDTDVDEIMCFAIFDKDGESLGVCIIQTWCRGGWEIYVPPSQDGRLDATEDAIRRIASERLPEKSNG